MAVCFVCEEESKLQKFLNCGTLFKHKLCELCLKKMTKTNGLALNAEKCIHCPLCRQITVLPNGDVSKLLTKFYAQLTCEDCSDRKDVEEQWWCITCEATICSKCAMVRHRSHNCSPWENYDVPKECLKFFKKRLKENENKNVMKQNVQKFCRQLELSLLHKIETAYSFDFFIDNIEKCFGILTLDDNDTDTNGKTNDHVTNVEKKWKFTLDLIKSTQKCSNVETEKLSDCFNEMDVTFRFPLIEDVLKLFEKKPSRDVTEKSANDVAKTAVDVANSEKTAIEAVNAKKAYNGIASVASSSWIVGNPSSSKQLSGAASFVDDTASSSSKQMYSPLWIAESSKRKVSPRELELADFKWCSCESSAGKYDWNVSWQFNFAFGFDNSLYYVDGYRLLYFRQSGDEYKVGNIVGISIPNETKTDMCPSQIVFNETRKTLFVTLQINDENKIGCLMEFFEMNLICVNTTKLPVVKGYPMKGNSLHLLAVLKNGTVVILITDGIKICIYLKFIKLMTRDQCDRVFENVTPSFVVDDVPLEPLTQMRAHFFEENKEMLIVSGKRSIYCFSVIKHKIHVTNYLQDVFQPNGFSRYCFSNESSLFIADFSRSKIREIQPVNFDKVCVPLRG